MPDTSLNRRSCVLSAKTPTAEEITASLTEIGESWHVDNNQLISEQHFAKFSDLSCFLQALLALSAEQNHHPQVSFGVRDCRVCYTTHSIGGISENDFICAAKINEILNRQILTAA